MKINEAQARLLVLAQAIETADNQGKLLSDAERDQIDSRAARDARKASGVHAGMGAVLARRAEMLLDVVRGRNRALSLKPEDYAKRIAAVNVACPDSKARAALSAFHHFLRTWDLAPSLPKGLFGDAPETQVKANRLWPHEIDRIHYWLEEAPQTRLIEAVRCAFAIGSSVPVRIGELLWQRLEGIRLGDILAGLSCLAANHPYLSGSSAQWRFITLFL